MQMALAQGVPLVAARQSEDKPEVCTRIEWAGVGINLKTGKPTQILYFLQVTETAVEKDLLLFVCLPELLVNFPDGHKRVLG